MTKDEDKFDDLLNVIRNQKPTLENPELLTARIMNEVSKRPRKSRISFLLLLRTVSSIAAMFLLGLFVYQQTYVETIPTYHKRSQLSEYKINVDSVCIQHHNQQQLNLMKTYICYMQKNSIKNKQLKQFNLQLN